MNMVKEGNISIEEAVSHAKGMGVDVDSKANQGLEEAEGKIHNFGVYKLNVSWSFLQRILHSRGCHLIPRLLA
jgi:hypothetical protein